MWSGGSRACGRHSRASGSGTSSRAGRCGRIRLPVSVRVRAGHVRAPGAIFARPREYLVRVFLPSFGAWLAKLGVIAVFLAGYGIAVTFHSVMSVMGGNSIANMVSVTPGGVGVNQATNVAALGDVTDPATATAYSLGQQLAVTAWNVVFAVALVVWAFGWAVGRELVEESYADAKGKVAEQKEQRAAKRTARRSPGDGRRFRLRRGP